MTPEEHALDSSTAAPITADSVAVPALELRGISKAYGTVQACRSVDLVVQAGEIHGLLGGAPVEIASPQDAVALGLGMVHQHFSLIDGLTVWENVVLGDSGKVDRA